MAFINPAHVFEVSVPGIDDPQTSIQFACGLAQINPEVYPVINCPDEDSKQWFEKIFEELTDEVEGAERVIIRIYTEH